MSRPAPTFGVPAMLPLAGTFITCIIPQLIDYSDLDAALDALPSPPSDGHFIIESDEQSLSDDPASEEEEGKDGASGEGKWLQERNATESTQADEANGARVDASDSAVHIPSPSFGDLLIARRAHQATAFEVSARC